MPRIPKSPTNDLGTIDFASDLLREYTSKLKVCIRKIRTLDRGMLGRLESRIRQMETISSKLRSQDELVWIATLKLYQLQRSEYTTYLRAILPQAKRLAQHASQLINHTSCETVVKLEIGLRIAEIESAIASAQGASKSDIPVPSV